MAYIFSALNEEILKKLYIEYGYTARGIGKIVGLSEDAILLKLRKYNIKSIQRNIVKSDIDIMYTGKDYSIKSGLTEDVLKYLYNSGLTDEAIGKIYGITGEAVGKRRRKFGIDTSTLKTKRIIKNHNNGLKDISELSKEELEKELYDGRGIKGVVRKFSSTFSTVKDILNKMGINRNSVLVNHTVLNDIQNKVIIGGLLGDGGVYDGGLSGYYYKEGHCKEQLDYLKWKKDLLGNMVIDNLYYETKISELGVESYTATFKTKSYSELSYYRNLFYRNIDGKNIKIIPEEVIYKMDALTLSIWFFDDGGLTNDKTPYICTGSPIEYVKKASEGLNEVFDLDTSISEMESVYIIRFNNIPKFYNVIKPYMHKCFYYKVPEDYLSYVPDLCSNIEGLSKLVENYTPELWKEQSEEEKVVWVNNTATLYYYIGFPYYKIKTTKEMLVILNALKTIDISRKVILDGVFNKVNSIGTGLASSYFPNMWSAEVRGKRSVYNNYKDSEKFKEVIENVFKYRSVLSEGSIRSELRHGATVQNFKPLIAKTLYDIYCSENGTVLDYSAGYGGRLLGAFVSKKVSKYIGIDPCQQTFFGLRKLMRRLERYENKTEFILYNRCAEEMGLYEDIGLVDVCFSSPPYFDTEKYSEEETQSYKRYPEINLWVENFLKSTIYNCNKVLKDQGYFLINIADTGKYELQRYAFEILSKIFKYERYFLIRMPSYFDVDKYEPIFVFKKDTIEKNPLYDEVYSDMLKHIGEDIKVKILPEKRKKNISKTITIDKQEAINCMKDIISSGFKPSRDNIKKLSHRIFPFKTYQIESAFGGWNTFVKECGGSVVYQAFEPIKHVEDYLKACVERGEVLSFYDYGCIYQSEKLSTKMKRLFNSGRPYNHLKNELKEIALNKDMWPNFLEKFKK